MKFPKLPDSVDASQFLRLKDGQSVVGVFVGDPYPFYAHWVNQKPVTCEGEHCNICKAGGKRGYRFKANFVTRDPQSGVLVAKIFEGTITTLKAMESFDAEHPLEDTLVKLSRKGAGPKDTVYILLPQLPDYKLSSEKKAQIAKVRLHVFDEAEGSGAEDPEPDYPGKSEGYGQEDIPF